jgi:hypothetical protein
MAFQWMINPPEILLNKNLKNIFLWICLKKVEFKKVSPFLLRNATILCIEKIFSIC